MINIVLGTRPEIIKLSPIIRKLNDDEFFITHTNQHYSENLDKVFFEELNLPKAKYNLNVGSKPISEQIGEMLIKIEKILIRESPSIVLVQGDTNSTLSGALAGANLNIDVAHVEAGLRSFNKRMQEEKNRIIVDHVSSYLFPPTEKAKDNLIREGINKNIFVVGNTIVDATLENIKLAEEKYSLEYDNYILLTLHRAENVDNSERFINIINNIIKLSKIVDEKIIFPIHPRTKKKLISLNLYDKLKNYVKIIEPLGYLRFLILEKYSNLILTDSGGVQEEACILKVPCITLRDETERPETLEVGSNILVGDSWERLIKAIDIMKSKKRNWNNPFGDGKAGRRIVKILRDIND
ncbi:non-hydrolyzing UDP-N-acetylglucosamine 2-epimerase [Methanocaldococcus sp.]